MAWKSGLQLRLLEGIGSGRVLSLEQKRLRVGRQLQQDAEPPAGSVWIDDATISRVHAELRWHEKSKSYILHHRSRTNQTRVNGLSVSKQLLTVGDRINMGWTLVELQRVTTGAAGSTRPTAGRAGQELLCPRDRTSLKPVAIRAMNFHRCPTCNAEWLERGKLSSMHGQADDLRGVIPVEALEPANCPCCGVPMGRYYFPGTGVEVTRCGSCLGIWLETDGVRHVDSAVRQSVPETTKSGTLVPPKPRPPNPIPHHKRAFSLQRWLTGDMEFYVSDHELAIFTRQFYTMLDAGIPLHAALIAFGDGGLAEGDLRAVLAHVAGKIGSGFRLSRALRTFPKVFSPVFTGLVETGENTGRLMDVLQRLADLLERQVRLRHRLVSALTYPCVLLVVSMLTMGFFVTFLLPLLEPLFRTLNQQLPWPTRLLLLARPGLPVAGLLALAALLFMRFGKAHLDEFLQLHPSLRTALARIPLQLPILGPVYRKLIGTRILYSLAGMVETGVGPVQALGSCLTLANNPYVASRLRVSQELVIDGCMLSESLAAAGIFPDSAIFIARAGEETSDLPTMLRYAANMLEEDAEMALTTLAATLEPLIMLGMGVLVGFLVIASILPTLQLLHTL